MAYRRRWVWGGVRTHPKTPKAIQIRAKRNPIVKTVKKLLNLGRQQPQEVRKKGSEILKLPPVRNWCTLALTNKLVVIINSLKVPKIKTASSSSYIGVTTHYGF